MEQQMTIEPSYFLNHHIQLLFFQKAPVVETLSVHMASVLITDKYIFISNNGCQDGLAVLSITNILAKYKCTQKCSKQTIILEDIKMHSCVYYMYHARIHVFFRIFF